MINTLLTEEMRNACDCPEKFQLLDFLGVLLGLFFVFDAMQRLERGADNMANAELALGAIMIFIHSRRFLFTKDQRDEIVNSNGNATNIIG